MPDEVYPKLVLLLGCKDVRISGVSLIRSRSWTIHPYACERLVIDGVYIHSILKDAVWADGIDPDGCKDVHIANSTIETGDDAIAFCDGNKNTVRRVTIANNVITDSNRGIAFMVFDGGTVEDAGDRQPDH